MVLRDRAIIQCFYGSGLRSAELRSLRLSDVRASALRVIGKGDKQRLVPMNPPQAAALQAYLDHGRPKLMKGRHEHDIVFVSASNYRRGGESLCRQGVYQLIRQLGREVLGRDIHPHQLRHSFGSTLIEHGADPRNVQALMGHADIETTMRYVHVDLRTIKEVHSKTHPRGDMYAAK
jgi:site-specific recombinase XerD